jgi:hypothetical protein
MSFRHILLKAITALAVAQANVKSVQCSTTDQSMRDAIESALVEPMLSLQHPQLLVPTPTVLLALQWFLCLASVSPLYSLSPPLHHILVLDLPYLFHIASGKAIA